ncbi:MAG TPA: hypothetical protein VNZ57_12265 [Longimicrobiales bacterium]|nr:hypothetical protein [Longimicrobiales bacterium]
MRPGVSIVEVVVAFAVLGACLPALFSASGLAARLAARAALLEGAVAVAEATADSVLAGELASASEWVEGPYTVSLAVTQDGDLSFVALTVSYFEGREARDLRFDIVHSRPLPHANVD